MATQNSFRDWLVREVRDALGQPSNPPPFLVWCDPDHSWRDLLNEGARAGGFELWAPEPGQEAMHELLVRDRFYRAKRVPRVIWLPCARNAITWFKPFELEATDVKEISLL